MTPSSLCFTTFPARINPSSGSLRCLRIRFLALLAWVFLLLPGTAPAVELRGFGPVTSAPVDLGGGIEGIEFTCENPARATVLMQKLGRDLEQSATVAPVWQPFTSGTQTLPVLVRPGLGAFLLVARENKVLALSSPQSEGLASAFAPALPRLAGARGFDPEFHYPKYLDKFSHYGIGSWYPPYWGEEFTKGKSNTIDDHFAFARKYDLTLQPNNGGQVLRNLLPKLHEYDRPYHFAQWHEWSQSLARLCPEELVQPGEDFTSVPIYYGQLSMNAPRLRAYRNYVFQQTMKEFKDDTNLVDWLDPHGELGPFDDYFYWDFSENTRSAFARWLRDERKYTLATLGQAWHGKSGRFHSWDEVPIPMQYDLYGWQPDSIMADREWRLHTASVEEGLRRGYEKDQIDARNWVSFRLPGGELAGMAWRSDKVMWYRGTLNVPEKWLKAHQGKGRIYLNAITLIGAKGWSNPDRIWVNGQEAGILFNSPGSENAGQVDVTHLLRPGVNTIAYVPPYAAYGMRGTFFLATQPLEKYPFSDPGKNARFIDWHEYVSTSLSHSVADTCRAIRAIDPDRPIKVHAAFDKDVMGRIMEDYGGYGHNTGEGSFLRSWDRRLGYPRGLEASAEFGGSIITEVDLKRWIGFFTFEGLTALDNFHNIQAMMYTPAAPVWVKYMPYLHLANRRDIKKPDIALFFSSKNLKYYSPKNLPMVFDLGRGDLQSIGYSYAYIDELSLEDGLAKDYPVLWDCDTAMMSPKTAAQIKAYVEAGGTFVAIQETGRHTFTHKDAWPMSDVTGFTVRETRPMEGAVTIAREQPIFQKLAGKTFYNRGKSIDYSNSNFADKCLVLEPAVPEARALARYQDGSIAAGIRTLGKGRVITLGSPFWRDSYDKAGLWWPGEGQCEFLEDLFAGLGLKPLAKADNHAFWREHYVAKNGTEEYLALWNPYDVEKTASLEWTTVHPAGALYDPKDGSPIPGTVNGNTVRLDKLKLAPYETLIVATQPAQPPQSAVATWFTQLSRTWKISKPGEIVPRPDLPVYEVEVREGVRSRVAAPEEALDLAALSLTANPGEGFTDKLGFIRPENLNLQLAASQKILYHCPVKLPDGWKPGDRCELVFQSDQRFNTLVEAFLNGKPVLSAKKPGTRFATADVSGALSFGKPNVLAFSTPSTGFFGTIQIVRKPKPAETLEVCGTWQQQANEESGLCAVELPGAMQGLFAEKRDVMIPASWRGSRVFIEIEPENIQDYNSFAINSKVVLHPVHWYPAVTYMDITPWVKFGEANTLTLLPTKASEAWEPGRLVIKRITLQRIPAK